MTKLLYNKFYIDEIYHVVFIRPIYCISTFFKKQTEPFFSSVIFGLGCLVESIGTQGKKLQNGSIGLYLFAFVLGLSTILIYLFLGQ